MNEQFNNNEPACTSFPPPLTRHSREGGNLRERPYTLHVCGEYSKEKLVFQNENSKIFEKK
jgi:hypothetical protein